MKLRTRSGVLVGGFAALLTLGILSVTAIWAADAAKPATGQAKPAAAAGSPAANPDAPSKPASGAVAPAASPAATPEGIAFFEQNIRPLLVERCYKCHSATAKQLRGHLFLDSKAGWEKGGDNGPAITPGDPDKSLVIKAVRYKDPHLQMPPKGQLSGKEVALLEQWVKMGAPDPRLAPVASAKRIINIEESRKHWSFAPLARPAEPAIKNGDWARNPIDRFIAAKLAEKNLTPSAPASRRVLIRRAYVELIGLPPTPQQISAFLNDDRPDAFERVIDELLASPHYGERWARHWLDVSRFAESHGFEHDYDRPYAYHFRDFVIQALNLDMPYDQFIKWQLAGDELAPDKPLAMMATGFLGAGVFPTQITANEVERTRYDAMDDMLATVGTGMLGLTIGCARCHDHKYDPIPAQDYYRMLSTFTTTVRSEIDLDLDPETYKTQKAAFDAAHGPLAAALMEYETKIQPGKLEEWVARQGGGFAHQQAGWLVLDLLSQKSEGGATFTRQSDGSLLVGGANPKSDQYTFEARTATRGVTGLRIEAMADKSLVKSGPGRASNGNFALTELKVFAWPAGGQPSEAKAIKLLHPKATFDQKGLGVAGTIDGNDATGWAVDPQFGKNHAAVYSFAEPLDFEGGAMLRVEMTFKNNTQHAIGRPRLSITCRPGPAALEGESHPQALVEVLGRVRGLDEWRKLKEEERAMLARWWRPQDEQWKKLSDAVAAHMKKEPKPKLTKVMVCSEGYKPVRHHTQGVDFFPETYQLNRGDVGQKRGVATQGFLQVLTRAEEATWIQPPPKGARTSHRRMAMANWITDTKQGAGALLSRVMVNRLWQHHMGHGIVNTPNDFGLNGAAPSHPELLEWLAADFQAGGWKIKRLHKLIMTSAAWRQGLGDPASHTADPTNAWFGRRDRRRLEAESIRDSLLYLSGMLDARMYGPGTLNEASARRSIYFTIKRSQLIPMMTLLDAPEPLVSQGHRDSTTVAPQALMFMNNAQVRTWAGGLARRIGAEGEMAPAVNRAYEFVLGRPAEPAELEAALPLIEAWKASGVERKLDKPAERALANFCQVLMGLNEFIYIE